MAENKTSWKVPRDITLDDLVCSELQGKDMAIERYDSILWKIRSGYVTILYGAISLLGGAISLLGREVERLPWLALALIWGFSICAFIIDHGFLRSKIQVVIAKDNLKFGFGQKSPTPYTPRPPLPLSCLRSWFLQVPLP